MHDGHHFNGTASAHAIESAPLPAAWTNFPAQGPLAPAVMQHIGANSYVNQPQPLAATVAPAAASVAPVHATSSPDDPLAWTLLKHLALLGYVAMAVGFALFGGKAPLLSIGYALTGLLTIGMFVVVDRMRFFAVAPATVAATVQASPVAGYMPSVPQPAAAAAPAPAAWPAQQAGEPLVLGDVLPVAPQGNGFRVSVT